MSKMYSESELRAMGLSQEQIDAVANSYEDVNKKEVVEKKSFADKINEELSKPLAVTPLQKIKEQSMGELVMLPGFVDNEDFIVKMRRPSLLAMVKQGRIPNTLLGEATELFANGTSTIGSNKENTLEDMMEVVEILCEAALVEPTWKELKDADIQLTDEQMMAIFSYSQRGIKGVQQFRNQ